MQRDVEGDARPRARSMASALDGGERVDDLDDAPRLDDPLRPVGGAAHRAGELHLPRLDAVRAELPRRLAEVIGGEAVHLRVGRERQPHLAPVVERPQGRRVAADVAAERRARAPGRRPRRRARRARRPGRPCARSGVNARPPVCMVTRMPRSASARRSRRGRGAGTPRRR